jgi:glucosamine 6-phosphate synthetase-like amidotransferase/phosphosugar isomerase protein
MFGIFGIIAKKGDIAKKLLIIARRLQYGGYDSLGLATYLDGEIDLRKDIGIKEFYKFKRFEQIERFRRFNKEFDEKGLF